MTDEEAENDAKSGTENQDFTDEMTFEETKKISEEGIYDAKIAIKDSAGNMKVFEVHFILMEQESIYQNMKMKLFISIMQMETLFQT